MYGHTINLRKAFFDAIFERGSHFVHLSNQQRALHDAVAGDDDAVLHLAHADVVAVQQPTHRERLQHSV